MDVKNQKEDRHPPPPATLLLINYSTEISRTFCGDYIAEYRGDTREIYFFCICCSETRALEKLLDKLEEMASNEAKSGKERAYCAPLWGGLAMPPPWEKCVPTRMMDGNTCFVLRLREAP